MPNVHDAHNEAERLRKLRNATERSVHARQAELEAAAAKHLPTQEKLKQRLETAQSRLRLRNRKLDKQRRVVKKLRAAGQAREPRINKTILSPCKSSRGGVRPRLIVLHLTVSHELQGLGDVEAVANYFHQLPTQASSNVIIDSEANCIRCVSDEDKAWAQAAYNSPALSIEQVGYADKASPDAWHKEYQKGLEEAALWCAWWSHKYDIPLVHSISAGVCEHVDLGAAGGGHVDVGPNYPLAWVIARAIDIKRVWGV